MVTIIYYADPTQQPTLTAEYGTVGEFLCQSFHTVDELLDLRFFENELLSHEIDQTGGEFLDINTGVVAITRDSMIPRGPETWIYVLVAVVVSAVAIITFKPDMPSVGSRDQSSSTNRLGDTTNEPRINERIDDIFGTVNKHMPPLWQVPYRIGVNDEETEILYLCVGRGKYQINTDRWFDGDTPMKDIPNASVSIYGPDSHPGKGTPIQQIGPNITEPIGIYRQSQDLNPSELEPPNAQDTTQIAWRATGTTTTATLTALSVPDGFVLTEKYTVGDVINMNGCVYMAQVGSIVLALNNTGTVTRSCITYNAPVDLSAGGTVQYTITAVTANTVAISIPASAPTAVKSAWAAMSSYTFPDVAINIKTVTPAAGPTNTWVIDPTIIDLYFFEAWGSGPVTYRQITQDVFRYYLSVGVRFDNVVGPIVVPDGATQAILNFVSPSGFYKLVENSEQMITALLRITVYQLNSSGVETGTTTDIDYFYSSHITSTRKAVFRTFRFDLPYQRQKISVRRITPRDKSDNVSNMDIVEWRDLYTYQPVTVESFGNVTTAHVVVPSNSQSRLVKQRKQNVDVTRMLTEYQGAGVFGVPEAFPTDRFDQILINTALDPYIGRMTLSDINADGFLRLRNQIINYFGSDVFTKFGYDFDTTELTYQDTFMMICNAVMCIPYVQAGVYDAFFERRQTESMMQITCRNKITGTETRKTNYDRKHDGVEVTYRDNSTGNSETIYVPVDRSSVNPERVTFEGVTTADQATKLAYRLYNKQVYQTETVRFDVDDFGRNIVPGARIDSPDSTRFTRRVGVTDGYRVYDGEVVSVQGLEVTLSEPVYFTPGEDHYITFTKEDGSNSESIQCSQVDDFHILLETLPSEPIYDGYNRDRTKYILVSEQLKQSVALIPRTIEFSLSDAGFEVHTINCVNYTDKYYQNDNDNG